MSPYLLTSFVIQNNYQNESKFNGVYSRNNLPKTKDGGIFDDYKSIETHWTDMYANGDNVTCFDGFGVEHDPSKI